MSRSSLPATNFLTLHKLQTTSNKLVTPRLTNSSRHHQQRHLLTHLLFSKRHMTPLASAVSLLYSPPHLSATFPSQPGSNTLVNLHLSDLPHQKCQTQVHTHFDFSTLYNLFFISAARLSCKLCVVGSWIEHTSLSSHTEAFTTHTTHDLVPKFPKSSCNFFSFFSLATTRLYFQTVKSD